MLDLSDNLLKDSGVEIFLLRSRWPNSALRRLRLQRVGMSIEGTLAVAFKLQSPECRLLEIDISSNMNICGSRLHMTFDPQPVIEIAETLKNFGTSLGSLDLSHNDIGARATRKLMETALVCTSLHSLNLRGCHLSEHGAANLAEALPNLKGLRWLNVSSCLFGPIGCIAFFNALAKNESLLGVDVSHNYLVGIIVVDDGLNTLDVDYVAVDSICTFLTHNTTLQYLNLASNTLFGVPTPPFGLATLNVRVVHSLASALRANQGLRSVNFSGNALLVDDHTFEPGNIYDKAAENLLSAFRDHPMLSSVTGQVYPRLAKTEFGRRDLYPEFVSRKQQQLFRHQQLYQQHQSKQQKTKPFMSDICYDMSPLSPTVDPAASPSKESLINTPALSTARPAESTISTDSTLESPTLKKRSRLAYDIESEAAAPIQQDAIGFYDQYFTSKAWSAMAEDGRLLVEPYMEKAWLGEEVHSCRPYRELRVPEPLLGRDMMTNLIAEEIKYNHYLEVVSVFSLENAFALAPAVKDNISLRSFWYPGSQLHGSRLLGPGDTMALNNFMVDAIELTKLESFCTRVSLAVFLRGTCNRYDCSIARHILEYLIGPGPLIGGLISKYLLK